MVQDVCLLFHRQPAGSVRSVRSWLRVAVLHLAARTRQRDRLRAEREWIVARPDRAPSVLEDLELASQQESLTALVNGLAEPYRETVRLRYLEGREIEEIAALVGHSPGTVRSTIKRGLDQLRVRLGVEPGRRRKLSSLVAGLWRRAVERPEPGTGTRFATSAALVSGIAAGALVLAVAFVGARPERERLLVSARGVEGSPRASLEDLTPAAGIRRAVPPVAVTHTAGEQEPEQDAWGIDVEGRVIDPDGRPVPGAAVSIGNEDGTNTRIAARSDSSGHYRIPRADRRLLIWAEDPGRSPSARHFLGSVEPERGLDLHPGFPVGALVGRVLSHENVPVARAEVVLSGTVGGFEITEQGTLAIRPPPIGVRTEADCSFRLGQLAKQHFRLLVQADGYPPLVSTFRRVPEGIQEIVLTLPSPCALEGQLSRPDGRPAAGARLELVFPEPLPGREAETDESGIFRFEALAPGPYALRLLEDPTGASTSCFVEGELAGERAWLTVALGEEHTLRGRVLRGDHPLAGWIVELDERDGDLEGLTLPCDLRRTWTAADGSFAFASCCPGRHVLRLFEPSQANGPPRAVALDVRSGQEGIVLRPMETLPGSLVGGFESTGPRLRPSIAVLLGDSFSTPLLLRVDPETGGFSASDLPPGPCELRAWVPRLGVWRAGRIAILPEQRTEFFVRVPEPGWIQVRVDLPESAIWDDLIAAIKVPAFQGSILWTNQRLEKCAEPGLFVAELFPGEYPNLLAYKGTRIEHSSARVESGLTTEKTVSLRDQVPVTLRLSLDRILQQTETTTLWVRTADWERRILISPTRAGLSETFPVLLSRDTQELRVHSSLGLSGRLAVTEGDIVPGGVLSMKLGEP